MRFIETLIQEATKCNKNEIQEIEDFMRNIVLKTTLNSQTKGQLIKAAKDAYSSLKLVNKHEKETGECIGENKRNTKLFIMMAIFDRNFEKKFKIERTGIYDLIYSIKCTKEDLHECLKYIDANDNYRTPLELNVDGVLFKLGKNGLSGRVFLYRKEENEWNMKQSNRSFFPQKFIEIRIRIVKYL